MQGMEVEQVWGPGELQAFIDREQIEAQLIGGLGDTPTVPAAAAALGVEPLQIVKTLLFLVERQGGGSAQREPVVVISHGERRVDRGVLAEHWGVSKKRVTLAPAGVVVEVLGYAAGGVPPFGHRTRPQVLIDEGILGVRDRFGGVVYGGGGDDRTMMRLSVDELLRVTRGEVRRMSPDAGEA